MKLGFVFSFFLIISSTFGGILYTSRFFSLDIKLTSEIVFLTDSQSYFYWSKTLTLSSVNLTCMWGFWFIFIYEISLRLSVFKASVAACNAGSASFNILSASFFYYKAFYVFYAMTFYYYSTTDLASPASFLSTSSFFRRFSC